MSVGRSSTIDPNGRLLEEYVQDSFHSYLKSSLAQAKAEHLLDVDMLSSAEGDLMITGTTIFLVLKIYQSFRGVPLGPARSFWAAHSQRSGKSLLFSDAHHFEVNALPRK